MKRIAQLPTGNIAFESSETQLEETILIGSISKIHTQLRRKIDIIEYGIFKVMFDSIVSNLKKASRKISLYT